MIFSQVSIICIICKKKFNVIKCRKNIAKCCSIPCLYKYRKQIRPWNKGLIYEKMYDVKTIKRIKRIQSFNSSGKRNCMFGKHHTEEARRKISKCIKGNIPWNKGKNCSGIYPTGKHSSTIKRVLRKDNITYKEYLNSRTGKQKYVSKVNRITKLQPIYKLKNYNKRGTAKKNGYHLDHIYPISIGFKNKISPKVIGNIKNLRFIPWLENIKKGNKLL